MSITDTWPTEGLKKYSERLKQFIHQRCTPCTPTQDELFEVPEFMKIDPLIRRPSKYKLSFADDFPYTRFKDDSVYADLFCSCNIYTRNRNLRLASHVLKRDELPKWFIRNRSRKTAWRETPPRSELFGSLRETGDTLTKMETGSGKRLEKGSLFSVRQCIFGADEEHDSRHIGGRGLIRRTLAAQQAVASKSTPTSKSHKIFNITCRRC